MRQSRYSMQSKFSLFVFLLPTLFFVLVFIAYPVVHSAYLSLCKYDYARDMVPHFIGFQGYIDTILHDFFFHKALIIQLKFAISYFVLTFGISLGMAILINELLYGAGFFQMLFYIPMIIPLALVGVLFQWILFPDLGVLNHILHIMGVSNWNINWFGDPQTALYTIVVVRSWKMIGFTLIIFLAGLQSLPKSLREAAKMDRANFLQEIWHIMLPNLKPYLLIGGTWILINSIKTFDLPAVVTQGAPGMSTLTLYYYTWKVAFEQYDMGKASQIAYIIALIIFILNWGLTRILRPETARRA